MRLLAALKFLIQLQLDRFLPSKITYQSVRAGSRLISCDVYLPQGTSRGCIVTINGFAPLGNRDRRFVALNRALAGSGYTVCSPYLPDFCHLQIHERQSTELAELFRSIAATPGISADGTIAILAPSFAAGLALIAAGQGPSSHLRAICTIGSFAHIDSLVSTLIGNQDADEYGRLILLRNFISLSIGKKPRIERALELAVLDNYYEQKNPAFPEFEASMPRAERHFLKRLREDADFRVYHWTRVVRAGGRKAKLLRDLSVVDRISDLKTPTVFIHGKDDDVIPSTQASVLFAAAQTAGTPAKLVITRLISHGDTQKGLHLIPDLLTLVRGFASGMRRQGRTSHSSPRNFCSDLSALPVLF